MTEAARPARPADLEPIARLHGAATAELAAERGGPTWAAQADRDRFAGFDLDDPAQLVLAGEIDGTVVGYARVRADQLADGRELAVLTDIYVEPGAREVGVGEALLDAAIAWASARGCVGIDSLALPGMRATKNFFEAAGLVARAIVVHRPLP
jgi:ribosomal protein S18 acetylase RimI-like enzyme